MTPRIVRADARFIVVALPGPHDCLSWAIVGGGRCVRSHVLWHYVRGEELAPPVDARVLLAARMAEAGVEDAVGLLTSRDLRAHHEASVSVAGITGTCVATAGLANALRVGDPPAEPARVGTINLLCHSSVSLSGAALLEAMSIAVEARTTAVLERGLPSPVSGAPSTGTGTDCVVVAAPIPRSGMRVHEHAGKHTAVGAALGAAVYQAVDEAVRRWARDRAASVAGGVSDRARGDGITPAAPRSIEDESCRG